MKRNFRIKSLLVVATLALAACGSDSNANSSSDPATSDPATGPPTSATVSGDVSVTDAWIRQPADGQTVAAGYGTIVNGTDEAITLTGASAPVSATVEVHETSVADDGTMSMNEKDDGFTLEPGATLTLEPGGPHVMMLDVDPIEFSGPLDLTFVFDSTEITVTAELREIGDAMADDSDMEMVDDQDS